MVLSRRPLEKEEQIDVVTGKEHMKLRDPSNNDVFWHNTIASVPHTYPTLIIGHEFLDALPIQKFQYTKKGWREILIDLKGHVDWIEDDASPASQKDSGHASAPLVKGPEEAVESVNQVTPGEPEFKEILCPHNNLATTAMLGGLFEGEQVEPATNQAESGMYLLEL